MKHHIRIPTTQYGYIETEFEGTEEEAIEKHNEMVNLYKGGPGLAVKEWQQCLDKYLADMDMDSNVHEKMDIKQLDFIQELKRAIKRIKNRQ